MLLSAIDVQPEGLILEHLVSALDLVEYAIATSTGIALIVPIVG
jgi:hypothetical protein